MVKPLVFATAPLPDALRTELESTCQLRLWDAADPPTQPQLRESLTDCAGLLCTLNERVDAMLLAASPDLRVISTCSVGVDHIDMEAVSARGIPVGHTPRVLTDATADLTLALLLACARRIPEADRYVRSGNWSQTPGWDPTRLVGRDLRDTTLGLIGLGPIGQAVARRAAGFGLHVIGWTPSGRAVAEVESTDFDTLVRTADILSLHIALAPQTRHLINADVLARMRPGALLINTARGPLVDEPALVEALASGHLGGAGLDVFDPEPAATAHPLFDLPNVVLAPHIGSATTGTRARMAQLAASNLLLGLQGQPMRYCANPSVEAKR